MRGFVLLRRPAVEEAHALTWEGEDDAAGDVRRTICGRGFSTAGNGRRLLRMSGDDCVIEAKAARRQGRLVDATALYVEAAESFRAEREAGRWAHALRHAAELAITAEQRGGGIAGCGGRGRCCRSSPPTALEMANALRVAAMAEAATGATMTAKQHWSEARALYVDAGVADGVAEADRHVAETLAIA